MPRQFDVAIIGGGASGALTAAWLLRGATAPLSIALIEKSGRFATGVAYGTRDPVHLLNVPAGKMSADPDDPEHLLRWLHRRGHDLQSTAFIPRALYGDYLQEFLGDAEVRAAPGVELHRIPCAVAGFDASRATLSLESGDEIRAREYVLAVGNLPPSGLRVPGFEALMRSPAYVASPWCSEVRQIPIDAHVAIIGTGLTAVDLLLSLDAHGHRGRITLLSRHALLPRPHAPAGAATQLPEDRRPRALLRWLRQQPDWRSAVDALRPITGTTWNAWTDPQRRQFDRHLRHLWEVHRHRMAPEIARKLEAITRRGSFEVRAGRLTGVALQEDRVTLALRGDALTCDVVVNCTGPAGAHASPLLQSLQTQGLAHFDRYGLITVDGRVVNAKGVLLEGWHAIGPMRRSELWETTAMPEIRGQAKSLAARLLDAVGRDAAANVA